MKIPDTKWMQEAVIQWVQKETQVTILGIDVNDTFEQEEVEVKISWDDLSGKKLDPRLINEARAEE